MTADIRKGNAVAPTKENPAAEVILKDAPQYRQVAIGVAEVFGVEPCDLGGFGDDYSAHDNRGDFIFVSERATCLGDAFARLPKSIPERKLLIVRSTCVVISLHDHRVIWPDGKTDRGLHNVTCNARVYRCEQKGITNKPGLL